MSIVDAIERAKQMGQQRRSEERRTREHRSPAPAQNLRSLAEPSLVAPGPGFAADATMEATAEHELLAPPAVAVSAAEIPQLSYDVAVCAANHIVVPDVEARLATSAAAPYRMLRTRLLQRCQRNGWSSLAITSPGPGEGKSVTALNLAISIAREGNHDVFLIDLDMRNPSLCRYLGLTPQVEVTDYFHGKVAPQDVLFRVGIDRLTLAGSRTRSEQSSELLAHGRLEELLATLRRSAGNPLVLLDLPPVVNTDDALVVAPRVDAMVLIASEGTTRRDGLERAVSLLQEYPLAGVILNRSAESLGGDYYGGAYA